MKTIKVTLFIITIIFSFSSCKEQNISKVTPSLKNAFKSDFLIGTALNKDQINGIDSIGSLLVQKQFNAITSENIMKSMLIHPEEDLFNFDMADKYVAFGEKNNMFILGHTLIWHSQLSEWIGKIKDSTTLSNVVTNHINTIVGRYKDRINSWDVVNEALNEDGSLRQSIFLNTLGEDYITQAFDLTSKADPNAALYYNDYNLCAPKKRNGAIKLIKKVQENGTKIDGIGIQAHWNLNGPSLEEIEKSIIEYSKLGIKVAFTELDITVLPNPWDLKGAEISQNFEGSPYMNPYPESLPDSVQNTLAKRYEDVFKLFLKHQDKISRVTFWGVHDGQSWLNGWPIKDRTNYPLIFDRKYEPKKAYYSIMNLKNEKESK